ncbi:MAG: dihydrodipicolinate reductase [Balneolaceae bacterium]
MVHVLHIGIGALGKQVLSYLAQRDGIRVVGAVDLNPALQGKYLHEVAQVAESRVRVSASIQEAIENAEVKPEVAVLTTVSSVEALVPQVEEAAAAGLHIVSTCEELLFPYKQHPEAANAIDDACKKHGVACLGTGINPGFLMDYLPSVLTSVCQRVDSVTVERIQDAAPRRVPFQKKIGAGLTMDQFNEEKEKGTLRHVGLPESVDLIAHALGWELDENRETLEPVLAAEDISSGYKPIKKGTPSGVQQVGTGIVGGREKIRLLFRAAVGEPKSYDKIIIKGLPNITSNIDGGVNGDVATCSITVNAVRSIKRCNPGLHTMLDVPVASWFG